MPFRKAARYIVSFREPHETLVSYYRFYEGWMFEPGTVTLAEYLAPHLDRGLRKDYWTHMESWWARRNEDDVLLLSYELMKEDLRPTVIEVAKFIGIAADNALIELVVRQSSREFMLEHGDRFDDLLHRQRSDAVGALPPGAGSTKVTSGEPDPGRYVLSPEIVEAIAQNWAETMGKSFGLHSYDELVGELRKN